MGESSQATISDLQPIRQPDKLMRILPFHYGWIILVAGSLGRMMTIPGQTVGVSSFLDPMIQDLGLERSVISSLFAISTLIASFGMPFLGRFVDKKGPRLSVLLISSGLAFACFWMGFSQGFVMLGIGFLLLRGLGQGGLTLVSMHVINLWFVERRGLAIGVAGVSFAIGNALFPVLIEIIVNSYGWRLAYFVMGIIICLTILPIGALFYRDKPEVYGMFTDGLSTVKKKVSSEVNFTFAEARKTLSFWLFVLGDFLVTCFATGLLFHHYSILGELGVARSTAALMFLPLGFVIAISNFIAGLAMDRIQPRYLMSILQLFLCVILFMATAAKTVPLVVVYSILAGSVIGMRGVLDGGIYAYYFGRLELGAIKGFASTISVAGTAVGPIILSLGHDLFGNYSPILWISMIFPFAFCIGALILQTKKPRMA